MDPEQILAKGAERGIAVDDFGPIWDSARMRLARASWQHAGLDPFLSHDVPYTGTSSGRLSEDAVDVFLMTASSDGPLRILELGAGSGIFARLFLDRLYEVAPKTYERVTYVVSDGSETVLAAQVASGVLDDHTDCVETRVLDLSSDWAAEGEYDAILGTYILDSLAFDLLAIKDEATWRKEGRCVVQDLDADQAEALKSALENDDPAQLANWVGVGRQLGLQTRHRPVDRADLPYGASLPRDTNGQTIPFVHCHGALACLDTCRTALRPGGVAVFSDYGHLEYLPHYEFLEVQAFGGSVAIGINYSQLSAAVDPWPDLTLVKPETETGNLFTRVFVAKDGVDDALAGLVDDLYGATRYQRLNDPLDKAREMLKSRFYESARAFYREAMAAQPRNWAIMEEVASGLLLVIEEYYAAIEVATLGLVYNPLSPGLWLAKGEALLALDRRDELYIVVDSLIGVAPSFPSAWRLLAQIENKVGNHAMALDAVAAGLKHDKSGDEHAALLEVQQMVLAAMMQQEHRSLKALTNQFRALDRLPD